jgi:hypothetical protein
LPAAGVVIRVRRLAVCIKKQPGVENLAAVEKPNRNFLHPRKIVIPRQRDSVKSGLARRTRSRPG